MAELSDWVMEEAEEVEVDEELPLLVLKQGRRMLTPWRQTGQRMAPPRHCACCQ